MSSGIGNTTAAAHSVESIYQAAVGLVRTTFSCRERGEERRRLIARCGVFIAANHFDLDVLAGTCSVSRRTLLRWAKYGVIREAVSSQEEADGGLDLKVIERMLIDDFLAQAKVVREIVLTVRGLQAAGFDVDLPIALWTATPMHWERKLGIARGQCELAARVLDLPRQHPFRW